MARRVSPYVAARYTGWAVILTGELPATFAALQQGRISEWRAMLVARETAWLSREHRAQVDALLAPRLGGLGDRGVERLARREAYRLDPHGYVQRVRGAESDRRVGLRPAPDAMARLTALLPVAQAVAAHTALTRAADTQLAAGDPRGRGQLMADTLVQRLTGQARADAVPVEVGLVMSDRTLLAGAGEPAHLDGYGPLPAPIARALVLDAATTVPVWLRRLYTRPGNGQLIAMASRRRLFTPAQRRFVRTRDQFCRTPYCEAHIRHADHIRPIAHGGATDTTNAAGLCAACNYAKESPGWRSTVRAGPEHEIEIHTPTGRRYRSRPPALPISTPAA